ncbi:hypothetical protein PLANPX_1652 [Lacipirellula parvula]|uniref:SD-repeat containing protein B domain-containing protein n=2 Tax=Lacipirellula parvula TaxID=2650471 RepID=A0A5K7X649_9BACT|nr:hypothetical protein PLANPX_1652 [Lacipirellula parvula]
MESRLLMAVDLAPPLLEQPADSGMIPDGDLFIPGSIAGRVVAVSAANDQPTAGDAGISGVRIELLADDGRVVAETLTDAEGRYDFPALEPGVYAIRETQPVGYDDGPEWLGIGGGWNEANDLISQIVVMPGADLTGYDFAERFAQVDEAEEPTPNEPAPNPTPMPIPEPESPLQASPWAGFVLPLTIEESQPVATTVEQQVVESPAAAADDASPLSRRRADKQYAGGGEVQNSLKLDLDAAITEGYELLAMLFDAFATNDQPDAAFAPVGHEEAEPAETAERDAAREQAFELHAAPPVAEVATPPATQPGSTPAERTETWRQVASKPAA